MSEFRIIVPIKQVSDICEIRFNNEKVRIDRESANVEPNQFDLNVLEEVVKFKE